MKETEEFGGECETYKEKRNMYGALAEKPGRRRPIRRRRRGQHINIKVKLKKKNKTIG
jgi:hypothetical protein